MGGCAVRGREGARGEGRGRRAGGGEEQAGGGGLGPGPTGRFARVLLSPVSEQRFCVFLCAAATARQRARSSGRQKAEGRRSGREATPVRS